jgi:hypothetical protein
MSDVYEGAFTDWDDIRIQFEMKDPFPEPEEVLYAMYDNEGYDGYAHVIYRNGNMIYSVTGSHCSCYGLEDQWDPEEYTPELFIAAWERGNWYRDLPDTVIQRVKELQENKYNGA